MVDRDRRHFFTKCLTRQIGKIVQGFEAGVAEARRKEEFDKFFSSYESSYALTLAYPDDILIETAQRNGIATEGRDKNDIVKELFVKKGARPAEAGEFTMRAFLNGQMDLSQAEAVADLISNWIRERSG